MKAVFGGANIKGTPSMSATFVRDDLRTLKRTCHVFGLQEFKWPWYWRVAERVLDALWNSFPRMARVKDSIRGAQALFWRSNMFTKIDQYTRPAYDFTTEVGDIMTKRWIRAVLLRAKSDGFTAWFLTTHFVVDGDQEHDSVLRKRLLEQNIHQLDLALTFLRKSGYPIMGELDANIHQGTWGYDALMKVFRKHGAEVHGEHGIEFSFTINNDKGKFAHVRPDKIGTDYLRTDHEVRLLHWTGHSLSDR